MCTLFFDKANFNVIEKGIIWKINKTQKQETLLSIPYLEVWLLN